MMRVVQWSVRSFGCVRSAQVSLAPGLNVLHGPNDVGKSTLVTALRAALLLSHTSSTHETFSSWGSKESPEVSVVFETEPMRLHRVTKVFGAGGKATLEYGKDLQSFSMDARGRQVDEKLRALLRWGVPAPGGKGGVRGWPESFLGTVFLSGPDAAEVLRSTLDKDRDESGKASITTALEALAEDKLFKAVLQRAMARVEEAYTSRGKRMGKDAIWTRIRDRINDVQAQRNRWQKQMEQVEAARGQVAGLEAQVEAAEAAVAAAVAQVRDYDVRLERQRQAVRVKEKLVEARGHLSSCDRKVASAREGRERMGELEAALLVCQSSLQDAENERQRAVEAHRLAMEALQAARGADKAREREIARGKLDQQRVAWQAQADELGRLRAWAEKARDAEQGVQRAAEAVQAQERCVAAREVELGKARSVLEAADRQGRELVGVRQLRALRRLQGEQREAEEHAKQAVVLRKQVQEKRQEAQALRDQIAGMVLPNASTLGRLRSVGRELAVAEAKLEVGLAVQVVPKAVPLAVQFSLDGGGTAGLNLSGPAEFPARREVRLTVGEVAEVTVRAGGQQDREAADRARATWREQVDPVLAAAGAAGIEQLEALCGERDRLGEQLARLDRDVARLDAEAGVKEALSTRLEELGQAVKRQADELAGFDRDALEGLAAKLTTDEKVEREARKRQEERTDAARRLEELQAKSGEDRVRLERERTQLEMSIRARDSLLGDREASWVEVLARADGEAREVASKLVAVEHELLSLAESEAAELEGAVERERVAALGVQEAEALVSAARDALGRAKRERDEHAGALTILQKEAGAVDRDGALAVVSALEQELAVACEGLEPVDDALVQRAREGLQGLEEDLRTQQRQLDTARGGLQQLGGDVARERYQEALETLAQLERYEAEKELEYEGWRTLEQALREAEQQEASHLGRILAKPLEKRFSELTRGRYGAIELGASLQTAGITAQGQVRDVQTLSTGTVEQLSTLFRLSLAEELGTVVVLDDHLSHTHSERMAWFRGVLAKVSERAQVVVVTCWPEHYVGEEGAANVVDLAQAIVRY